MNSKEIEFKVGNRVTVKSSGKNTGYSGTIATINILEGILYYGVVFKEEIPEGHDLQGLCKDKHGFWFASKSLMFHKDTPVIKFIYTYQNGITEERIIVPQDIVWAQDGNDRADYLIKAYDVLKKEMTLVHPKRIIQWL